MYTNFCFGGGLKKTDISPVYSNISQASLAASQIYHTAKFCNLVRTSQVFSSPNIAFENFINFIDDKFWHLINFIFQKQTFSYSSKCKN